MPETEEIQNLRMITEQLNSVSPFDVSKIKQLAVASAESMLNVLEAISAECTTALERVERLEAQAMENSNV